MLTVAKQEAGLNDTSGDLVTRGKERRNPEDEMEAGAPLQEEMITRKVDDQVGNRGGRQGPEPRGIEGNWSPPEVEKNTQEEPGDSLYTKQVGDTGGEARSCKPEEVKAAGAPLRWRRKMNHPQEMT